MQVKARTTDANVVRRERLLALVRGQTFRPRLGYYLLFLVVDVTTATFDTVWLVPSTDFVDLARARTRRHVAHVRFAVGIH